MKKIFFIVVSGFISLTAFVYAAGPPSQGVGTVNPANVGKDPYTSSDIGQLFAGLVNWFAWFIALVSVVMGLYAAFLFITGGGDEAKLKKAKDVFIYTIIGIIVAMISFGIVTIAKMLIQP